MTEGVAPAATTLPFVRLPAEPAAAHVRAAIPNASILEFIAPSRIPWRNDVLKAPLVVPDRPDLGVEFDEDAPRPYVVSRPI